MNWGYKIIVVYAVFVSGMIFMAYKSSQQNEDLVTEDYYGKELVYQQKIDEMKRTSLLTDSVLIQVINHEVSISFPKDFATKNITGEVEFYCPSDGKKDKRQQFSVTDTAVKIPLSEKNNGMNYVKISWTVAGINYYYEKKIII